MLTTKKLNSTMLVVAITMHAVYAGLVRTSILASTVIR